MTPRKLNSERGKPNFSMFIPPKLRTKIDKKIEDGEYSSVAGFLIEAANKNLNHEQL